MVTVPLWVHPLPATWLSLQTLELQTLALEEPSGLPVGGDHQLCPLPATLAPL